MTIYRATRVANEVLSEISEEMDAVLFMGSWVRDRETRVAVRLLGNRFIHPTLLAIMLKWVRGEWDSIDLWRSKEVVGNFSGGGVSSSGKIFSAANKLYEYFPIVILAGSWMEEGKSLFSFCMLGNELAFENMLSYMSIELGLSCFQKVEKRGNNDGEEEKSVEV